MRGRKLNKEMILIISSENMQLGQHVSNEQQ